MQQIANNHSPKDEKKLNEIICKRISKLFGRSYFEEDNKILFPSEDKMNTVDEKPKVERGLTYYSQTVTEIESKICTVIDPNDDVYRNEIIKDLAVFFFSNDDLLCNFDTLWGTTESKLVGELIVKLFEQFNNAKNNMAVLSGCLICAFREIVKMSSFPPGEINRYFTLFIDCIRKYAKYYDIAFWIHWLLPRSFSDWCSVLACVFLKDQQIIEAILEDELVLPNAMSYFTKIEQCKYVFINSEPKTASDCLYSSGSNDLLDTENLLSPQTVPSTSVNNVVSESETKKRESGNDCVETTNEVTIKWQSVEGVSSVPSSGHTILVCSKYSFSNSFKRYCYTHTVDQEPK